MERGAAGLTGAMTAIIATLGRAEISAVEAAENAPPKTVSFATRRAMYSRSKQRYLTMCIVANIVAEFVNEVKERRSAAYCCTVLIWES
jgi:hypothetical protein